MCGAKEGRRQGKEREREEDEDEEEEKEEEEPRRREMLQLLLPARGESARVINHALANRDKV